MQALECFEELFLALRENLLILEPLIGRRSSLHVILHVNKKSPHDEKNKIKPKT
jgi:hypothetical protein